MGYTAKQLFEKRSARAREFSEDLNVAIKATMKADGLTFAEAATEIFRVHPSWYEMSDRFQREGLLTPEAHEDRLAENPPGKATAELDRLIAKMMAEADVDKASATAYVCREYPQAYAAADAEHIDKARVLRG